MSDSLHIWNCIVLYLEHRGKECYDQQVWEKSNGGEKTVLYIQIHKQNACMRKK